MLNKGQLRDAAQKIASVKALEKTSLTEADQPVTFSPIITIKTLGVVFAYDSSTSLQTLAENLAEINADYPSTQWIDIVVVLDKGVIDYMVKGPFDPHFMAWSAGVCDDDFLIPPFYFNLVKADFGVLTLNHFFCHLSAHLAIYRKRSAIPFKSLLDNPPDEVMAIKGYQYNLDRKLVDADEYHQVGKFRAMKVRYNLFSSAEEQFIGQICYMQWKDGAAISYSGSKIPPQQIYSIYERALKRRIIFFRSHRLDNWLSNVLPLSKAKFIEISESIHGEVIIERDTDDDSDLPWTRGPKTRRQSTTAGKSKKTKKRGKKKKK